MHRYITTHSKVYICSLKRICQIELNELIELIELIWQIELIQQIELTLVLNLGKPRLGVGKASLMRAKSLSLCVVCVCGDWFCENKCECEKINSLCFNPRLKIATVPYFSYQWISLISR